jgi:drug/metabolite transporter (DMT)-like permease
MMVVAGVLINAAAKAGTFIRPDLRSLATCLAVSVQVSVFTLFDGFGVRSSDAASPAAYAATLAICDGLVSLTVSLFYRSLHRLRPEAAQIRLSLLGGTLAALSFWIGIWAISMAPLGMVSALRESSILFAVVFSAFLLKERLSVGRIAGSATILLGIILIKFSV